MGVVNATPTRFVALGDSLTEGIGDDAWPDGTPRGWADRFADLLAQRGSTEYANIAVRGMTSRRILNQQLDAALAANPHVVAISAGMNDILRAKVDFEEISDNLATMVTRLTAGGARVVVIPIPRVERVTRIAWLVASRRRHLNELIAELAANPGVVETPDTTGSVFEDPRAWASDRLHLSPLGHHRLALAVASSFGVADDVSGWNAPVPGLARRRRLGDDARWWAGEAIPWIGRRLSGRSSGDARTAKRPDLTLVDSPPPG